MDEQSNSGSPEMFCLDSTKLAAAAKKNAGIHPAMGRPKKGSLSTYPADLLSKIKTIRQANTGWGADSILYELEEVHGYSPKELPGKASINRYLKQEGLVKTYEPHGDLPTIPVPQAKQAHDLWEMDAQGAIKIAGIGHHSMINIKDNRSKKYCMSFPVSVKNHVTQPSTRHYLWALRIAFTESGLPKTIQVDKDSVFYENNTKSPFPKRIHLWLTGLGVNMSFINVPPPLKQAMVERSHQTMEKQVFEGKTYPDWQALFKNCNQRRKRLNEKLPCRTLRGFAPLQAFPGAAHSGRTYGIKQEYELFKLNNIYDFLAKGKWFRKVSSAKTISLGNIVYYISAATPKTQAQITFGKESRSLIIRDVNEHDIGVIPIKGISKSDIIGMDTQNLISTFNKLMQVRDFPL